MSLLLQLKVICRGVKVGNGSSGLGDAGHVPSLRCFFDGRQQLLQGDPAM